MLGVGPGLAIEYVGGDGQEAIAGTVLPQPYEVEIKDETHRSVSGAEVRFDVISGDGMATPSLTRTDSLGRASTFWRLGTTPGFQRLRASSPQAGIAVTFTAISRVSSTTPDPGRASQAIAAAPEVRGRGVTVSSRRFAAGGSMVCTLFGPASRVTCRGANDRGQVITGGAPGSLALAAGLFHVCTLDASGAASCWGANEAGQLGDGTRVDRDVPTPVATDLRFSTLTAGGAHTCGLTSGGQAVCWGSNVGGQLGDGSREDRLTPGRATTQSFERIVAGWSHTCGITADEVAYCWGLSRDGQLGDGSHLDRLAPRQITTGVSDLAAGSSHTCAIASGRALCWGDNRFGQLGDGTTEAHSLPEPVVDLPATPISIVAGAAHTCALFPDGSARCWGQDVYGQLGDEGGVNALTSVPVAGGLSFAELSAGGAATCGRTALGSEFCWGLNQSGQLGDGTLTNRAVPTLVRE
jgi:alpha-tubulin suppressor-like RCC1 family protein